MSLLWCNKQNKPPLGIYLDNDGQYRCQECHSLLTTKYWHYCFECKNLDCKNRRSGIQSGCYQEKR